MAAHWELISYFIPHFIISIITYPWWDYTVAVVVVVEVVVVVVVVVVVIVIVIIVIVVVSFIPDTIQQWYRYRRDFVNTNMHMTLERCCILLVVIRAAVKLSCTISLVNSLCANCSKLHYSDVIMGAMASQITGFTIFYSAVNSGGNQWKHQSSASLAFVRGIHRWPMNSPHKWPVTN